MKHPANFTACRSTIRFASLLTLLLVGSGCASIAVSGDAIEDRTAFALSLAKNEFTISDRRDDGVRTEYSVQTKGGARYRCYVGGSISVIGRVVSDAICNPVGGGTAEKKDKVATPAGPACNALLKSAGKC